MSWMTDLFDAAKLSIENPGSSDDFLNRFDKALTLLARQSENAKEKSQKSAVTNQAKDLARLFTIFIQQSSVQRFHHNLQVLGNAFDNQLFTPTQREGFKAAFKESLARFVNADPDEVTGIVYSQGKTTEVSKIVGEVVLDNFEALFKNYQTDALDMASSLALGELKEHHGALADALFNKVVSHAPAYTPNVKAHENSVLYITINSAGDQGRDIASQQALAINLKAIATKDCAAVTLKENAREGFFEHLSYICSQVRGDTKHTHTVLRAARSVFETEFSALARKHPSAALSGSMDVLYQLDQFNRDRASNITMEVSVFRESIMASVLSSGLLQQFPVRPGYLDEGGIAMDFARETSIPATKTIALKMARERCASLAKEHPDRAAKHMIALSKFTKSGHQYEEDLGTASMYAHKVQSDDKIGLLLSIVPLSEEKLFQEECLEGAFEQIMGNQARDPLATERQLDTFIKACPPAIKKYLTKAKKAKATLFTPERAKGDATAAKTFFAKFGAEGPRVG
jgi:hypothetical protein